MSKLTMSEIAENVNSTTFVSVSGLKKRFGEQVAVDGIDLSIKKGEALGLLGPNGAGKSTTIKMLVGLLEPDAGEVDFGNGLSPSSPETRQCIGIAPQELSLYDDLTTAENLRFFGKLYGLRGSHLKQRVDWGLEFAGLQERRAHRVKTLSGGMRRRLNLATALLHEPRLVLLDEPTVGVDPHSRNHLLDAIEQLKTDGLTLLYTTHYMEEAQRLCDRVAIIDHGRILAIDTVTQLLKEHGGASVVFADVSGSVPAGVKLPAPLEDGSCRWESHDAFREVSQLVSRGIEFSSLKITQPDLESVFLSLTGRSLRDS